MTISRKEEWIQIAELDKADQIRRRAALMLDYACNRAYNILRALINKGTL